MKISKLLMPILFFLHCLSSDSFRKTVSKVDLNRFMGKWYVIASRGTSFEEDAFNAIEIYTYNSQKEQIDIDFTFRKGSLTGPLKSMPQTGKVIDKENNSYWKVSPFWPLKFDYLIIDLEKDYNWTVIGVPNQKYVWIMARQPKLSETTYEQIITRINGMGYDSKGIKKVIHSQ